MPLAAHATLVEKHHPIGERSREIEIVSDGQTGECRRSRTSRRHQLEERDVVRAIEMCRGFVEQQDLGSLCERARQRDQLLLAARELGDQPVREVLDATDAQCFCIAASPPRRRSGAS